MLTKQIIYNDLDDVAGYVNILTEATLQKFKKQSKFNRRLTVVSILTLVYAVVEIKNLKEEIAELKNKKGV